MVGAISSLYSQPRRDFLVFVGGPFSALLIGIALEILNFPIPPETSRDSVLALNGIARPTSKGIIWNLYIGFVWKHNGLRACLRINHRNSSWAIKCWKVLINNGF